MTSKRTWTEEEYEAAGKKSIHLRLSKTAHDTLSWLANKMGIGRTELVEKLVRETELKERNK